MKSPSCHKDASIGTVNTLSVHNSIIYNMRRAESRITWLTKLDKLAIKHLY